MPPLGTPLQGTASVLPQDKATARLFANYKPRMHTPMQEPWSSCPPDVLVRCFKAQYDYVDNSAAACVCSAWNDTFRTCAEDISIQQKALSADLWSSTYLQQFTGVRKVDLLGAAAWPKQHVGSWLTEEQSASPHVWDPARLQRWTEIMQSVPASCQCLTLLDFLPQAQNFLGSFSQLTNLTTLHIHTRQECDVSLRDIANLWQLKSLTLIGVPLATDRAFSLIRVYGRLQDLPEGIASIQLRCCCSASGPESHGLLTGLGCLPELTALVFSSRFLDFDKQEGPVNFHQLKELALETGLVASPQLLLALLQSATRLQSLSLRNFELLGHTFALPLGDLLAMLPSLVKLDVTSCHHVWISPSDCWHLKLHAFAFHYSQLTDVDASHFTAFTRPSQDRYGHPAQLIMQLDGFFPHVGSEHWLQTMPLFAITHLTISDSLHWPLGLVFNPKAAALPNLLFLDVFFSPVVTFGMDRIRIPAGSRLQELYVGGTSCAFADFTACTMLTSLGITHRGLVLPILDLPASLERLYLHNVLKADTDPQLCCLSKLTFLKLGGRAITKGIMSSLPELPPSLLELDLWDGAVTKLDQLTLLTKLKKLTMPLPPTCLQAPFIKQLRQLRHIEVTTHEGIHIISLLVCILM